MLYTDNFTQRAKGLLLFFFSDKWSSDCTIVEISWSQGPRKGSRESVTEETEIFGAYYSLSTA